MNIFHLKCFYDAVLMNSISESARRNFISQPAVTKAIKSLENSLGVKLIHSKKHMIKLTHQGDIVFRESEEVFKSIRNLKNSIDESKKNPSNPIRFVTTQSVGLSFFPLILPDFKRDYPNLPLQFLFGGISQIKNWLKQGIYEFAIVVDSDDFSNYQKIPLYEGIFKLYKHKNEKRDEKSAECYVEHYKGFMVSEFQKKHQIHFTMELNSWELIARTVDIQGGYGLIPDMVLFSKKYPNLVPAQSSSLPYKICGIHPKGEKLSYSAKVFLQKIFTSLK